ncbi:alpha/beta hydrolase family protein [Acholeplasma granularum]|uniref:alpha/beta hydrolase family protein n=1 Tax=Acholeplasma granularum TaxID=264635 RepID=UPI000472C913|nr:alpha/beta hydrolase [Acholeplasma granularum]
MKINKLWLDGIPLTTYEIEDNKEKPLIYFFHGFSGNKDANIMGRGEILANLGFYVVAIDAYMHGERMSHFEKNRSNVKRYEDIIEIVIHTAHDAKHLFAKYFSKMPLIIKDSYHAYGVSMGSLTAFYLGTIDTKLKMIIGIVPTPSFVEYYEDKANMYGFNEGFFYDRKIDYYKKIDPTYNYLKLKEKTIYMACGIKDEIVPNKYAIKLHEYLPESTIKFYDTGHVSTDEMLKDSYSFLKNEVF